MYGIVVSVCGFLGFLDRFEFGYLVLGIGHCKPCHCFWISVCCVKYVSINYTCLWHTQAENWFDFCYCCLSLSISIIQSPFFPCGHRRLPLVPANQMQLCRPIVWIENGKSSKQEWAEMEARIIYGHPLIITHGAVLWLIDFKPIGGKVTRPTRSKPKANVRPSVIMYL